MSVPKVRFVYSPIYETVFKERNVANKRFNKKATDKIWKKERIDRYVDYTRGIQKKWDKINDRAMRLLSETYKLEWKEVDINCYVMDSLYCSFSLPTTLRIYRDWDTMQAFVIHELGHRLELSNTDRINWKRYNSKFKKEQWTTWRHILLYAVLKQVYSKLFGELKTKSYVNLDKNLPDYSRAWQIVEKYGAENIIKEFIR